MLLRFTFNKESFPKGSSISLPYGLKKIKIKVDTGLVTIMELGNIGGGYLNIIKSIEFPIVDGKSPNTFNILYWNDSTKEIEIFVEELGGIPDPNYFSGTPTVIPEIISDEPTEQEEKKDAI